MTDAKPSMETIQKRINEVDARSERLAKRLTRGGVICLAGFAILSGAFYIDSNSKSDALRDEGHFRISESCKLFVGRYNLDLYQNRRTQQYLDSLSPRERKTNLNRRIRTNFMAQVERTRTEIPPAYCGKKYARLQQQEDKRDRNTNGPS